jgi:hypothetical protein
MKKTLTAAAATALLATGALADDTASIKPIVGAFLGAVLQGDVDTMREVANADYIQHNPFIPTGLEPFIEPSAGAGRGRHHRRKHPHVRRRQLCLHAQHLAQCRAVRRR